MVFVAKNYGLSPEDCLLELTLTVTPDITVSNPRSYRNSIEYSTEDSPAPAAPALDLVFIQNFQELCRKAVLQNLLRKRTQTNIQPGAKSVFHSHSDLISELMETVKRRLDLKIKSTL